MSPNARTLKQLRKEGWDCQVVEQTIPGTFIKRDLFGIIDIVAVRAGLGVRGIQATTGSNHSARRAKALKEPRLITWLAAGGRFEIWSWTKKANRWVVRQEVLNGVQCVNEAA